MIITTITVKSFCETLLSFNPDLVRIIIIHFQLRGEDVRILLKMTSDGGMYLIILLHCMFICSDLFYFVCIKFICFIYYSYFMYFIYFILFILLYFIFIYPLNDAFSHTYLSVYLSYHLTIHTSNNQYHLITCIQRVASICMRLWHSIRAS